MPHGRRQWFEATRTLQTLTADQQRTRADSVPDQLAGSFLLLVRHGDQPVRQYLSGDPDRLKRAGARAGFRLDPIDEPPDIPDEARRIHHPIIPWRSRLNSISNMESLRQDMEETRRGIEAIMPPDSYVSIAIRPKGYFENTRIRNWIADEHQRVEDDNPFARSGTMIARISCGAATHTEAAELAIGVGKAAMPLMSDIHDHRSRPKLAGFLTAMAILAILLSLTLLTNLPFIPMIVLTLLSLIGTVGMAWRWWRWSVWDDILTKPRHDWRPMARRRFKRAADSYTPQAGDQELQAGAIHKRSVLAYPTQRSSMIVAPGIVTSMFTPIGEATAMSQDSHPAPTVLCHGGIYLGEDQTGRSAYLDPATLHEGVVVFGEMGSGKSVLTYGIQQWAELARTTASSKTWGSDTRVIDYVMKDDDGIHTMEAFRDKHHITSPESQVCWLADPSSPCPDMLGMLENRDARLTAVSIARTMQFSFDKGDIMNDSLDVITTAMTIGVACARYPDQQSLVDRCRTLEQKYPGAEYVTVQNSPIGWAVIALAAGEGQTGSARALGQVVRGIALETNDPDMTLAARAAEQLYGRPDKKGHTSISDQRLLDMTRASRNKVRQFLDVEHLFTPARATRRWTDILETPGDWHFVFTKHDGHQLPEGMTRILGRWMMYRMWNTVLATCDGWRAKGRHTMFVCDELTLLSDADDEILCSMHEQGRSFGWIMLVATQFPTQLTRKLMESVLGYSTMISFKSKYNEIAAIVAGQLTDNDGADGWTAGAVRSLPQYWAAVRTSTTRQLQPAFLVHVHNFKDQPIDRVVDPEHR